MFNSAADNPFDLAGMNAFAKDKQDVNYREGSTDQSCGSCANFTDNGCLIVAGPVVRSAVCDEWKDADRGRGSDSQ